MGRGYSYYSPVLIMFAIVDCNNFYASCERLFRPELEGQPIVVLSNNDGCVIARSNEAKALGIEISEYLNDIARNNINSYNSKTQKCKRKTSN